jgi:beta-lactam-binding protein with PASTA domain/tRNA A-37 threonylcarbamoyl transferase component Bud32
VGSGTGRGNLATTRLAEYIGRVLGGRYRLLAPIGTGASAHVYLADDVKLRRRVAVKILHPALADDEGFLRRFRAEAHAAAGLNHANVMAVYDWGEEADGPYLVCEFLGGGSLRSILDRGTRLTQSQALMVGLEAARALDYASRRGLVHRDIKPANLLFDEEGRLRIADFGLARALAEAAWTEPSGTLLGTARYASPEQVRGARLDGKADVYSLAIVLYEAVTGRVPFVADTTVGTLMGRLEQPIPVAPELGPLGPIVARAGRPEASERLDAMALGAALQATANDLPAPGRLPLAGIAALDETLTRLDDDPTEIGHPGTRPAAEVATGAATQWEPAPPGPGGGGEATATLPLSPGDAVPAAPAAQPPGPAAPPLSKAGRRRRRWPIVAVVALVVALAGAGAAYAIAQANVPSHPVPNEVNRPEAEATAALKALKFKVAFRRPFVNGTTAGQVTDQSPDARPGRTLKEGHVVTLTVSRGPEPIPVPDLANLDRTAAEAAIAKAGFVVGDVTEIHDEKAPAGALLDFNPKTGLAPTGSKIALTVSSGPAPRVVPDLAGKSFAAASAALSDIGLEATRGEDYSDTVPAGQVIGTTPAPGASVDRGATVTVVVSQGQPTVPDLKGLTVSGATARLQAAGLKVGGVYGPPGGNYVLLTVPGSGATVKRGASISLFVL